MNTRNTEVAFIEREIALAMSQLYPGKDFTNFKILAIGDYCAGTVRVERKPNQVIVSAADEKGRYVGGAEIYKLRLSGPSSDKEDERMSAHMASGRMHHIVDEQSNDIDKAGAALNLAPEELAAFKAASQALLTDFVSEDVARTRPFTIVRTSVDQERYKIEMGFTKEMLDTKSAKIEEKLGENNSLRIVYILPNVIAPLK